MGGMKGKVASVPGGAGSIGAASVRELVLEGASVAIADILTEEGEALARELGSQVLFSETDLRSDEQIERCVDATVKQFGRIDFLINAAASYHDKGFECSRADWAFTFDVNVFGSVFLLQKAHSQLVRSGPGAVVYFTSKSATHPLANP